MEQEKLLQKEIVVHAPIDQIWTAWTTEEGLKSFFAPDCKVELTPGGKYEMYFLMDNEPGLRGSEGCIVLSYIKHELFSFSWNAPPQFAAIRNNGPQTMVFLNFHSLASGSTHIKLRHLGWQEGEEWDTVYNYFDAAWTDVLKSLKKNTESY